MEGIFESNAIRRLGLARVSGQVIELKIEPEHCSTWNTAHTYVIAALIEMAGGNVAPADVVPVDVSFKLLKAIRLGETAVAHGFVLRAGRTAIFTETKIYVGDTLVGSGSVTFLVMQEPPPKG